MKSFKTDYRNNYQFNKKQSIINKLSNPIPIQINPESISCPCILCLSLNSGLVETFKNKNN